MKNYNIFRKVNYYLIICCNIYYSVGPSSSASCNSSSGVSSSGLNSPPLPIPSSSFSPSSSNKYTPNILQHSSPLLNVKNEIPSAALHSATASLPPSLYHQSSAVTYSPIMPITTPTLHMTWFLLIFFKFYFIMTFLNLYYKQFPDPL